MNSNPFVWGIGFLTISGAFAFLSACSALQKPNALGCTYEGLFNNQVQKKGGYVFQINEKDSKVLLLNESKVQNFQAIFSPDEIIFSNKWVAGYYGDSVREDYFSINRKNLNFLMEIRQDGKVYGTMTGKCKKIYLNQTSNQI
jgi:hypothetical protein